MVFGDVYKGKTVFITGHTGFKGSWLSEWLLLLGANVVGYSLEPPTEPSLFAAVQLNERLTADIRGDVRSLDTIQARISKHTPDFIFHLAAQPLVRKAYDEPYETFETNIMGSLNVLEAVRRENRNYIVIMITTDKVYENVEWEYAYRQSFFSNRQDIPGAPIIAVASVRGGNVIGGGDWAEGRIVPDWMKSLARNQIISVRNKSSTRPWQHVLELLSGYLHLGAEIFGALTHQKFERLTALSSPFNFGPHITSNKTVEDIVQEILKHWPGDWEGLTEPDVRHEAGRLNLTIDKAYHTLGWHLVGILKRL